MTVVRSMTASDLARHATTELRTSVRPLRSRASAASATASQLLAIARFCRIWRERTSALRSALSPTAAWVRKENAVFEPFYMISFYQDRLGTNVGKALRKKATFSYRLRAEPQVRFCLPPHLPLPPAPFLPLPSDTHCLCQHAPVRFFHRCCTSSAPFLKLNRNGFACRRGRHPLPPLLQSPPAAKATRFGSDVLHCG